MTTQDEENQAAKHMLHHIEILIKVWSENTEEASEACKDGLRPRFDILQDMVKDRYGENGHLAWGVLVLGITAALYFQGLVPEQAFQEIRKEILAAASNLYEATRPAMGSA